MERNLRKERIGVVVSNKMDKSIVVAVERKEKVTQDEFSAGESYVSIMWKNVEAIRKGLN